MIKRKKFITNLISKVYNLFIKFQYKRVWLIINQKTMRIFIYTIICESVIFLETNKLLFTISVILIGIKARNKKKKKR